MTDLYFHNSRTRRRERFVPLDPSNVRMYVCGVTVYDRAHIGNARALLVFDVLARLLRALYPQVTYVRNITDVDDKINLRAATAGLSIGDLTAATSAMLRADEAALGILPPDIEPCATEHIDEMIVLIDRLIGGGHAYEARGHVLFEVASFAHYGALSGRSPDELRAGARVEIAPYKRDPGDFVLWKPSDDPALPGWDSPWGRGRPGWHIECSAMSWRYLGENFDLHGGGHDLLFPHHENEVAQSRCAFPGSDFANIWLHNGMLRLNGEKMSKSLGNVLTIPAVLDRAPAEAVRLLLLQTHYRSELDFTFTGLSEARRTMNRFYRALEHAPTGPGPMPEAFLAALADDLNTPRAISELHALADQALAGNAAAAAGLRRGGALLGLLQQTPSSWFQGSGDAAAIAAAIAERGQAKAGRDFIRADQIRAELLAEGVIVEDTAQGTTWRRAR